MMSYIGLGLIIVAWLYQFFSKGKDLKSVFALGYFSGVVLLAVDGYMDGLTVLAVLNLVSAVVSFGVFLKSRK